MTDVTGIANITLVELGEQPITEIGEGSERANILRSNFNQVRDLVLRLHPWNSAIRRKKIAVDQTIPEFGWAYRYPMPTDPYCLRVLSVDDNQYDWKAEGRWILTNSGGPINVLFVSRPASAEVYDAALVDAIALKLAERCAYRITNSRAKEERAAAKFKTALRDARSADGQEGTPDHLPESEILLSRFSDQ